MENDAVVVDTNVLISYTMNKNGVSGQAVSLAMQNYTILQSNETFSEFVDVVNREKFDKYISDDVRNLNIDSLSKESNFIDVTHNTDICRDPKDNKFLDLAVSGNAKCILSGDKDLLDIKNYQGIDILSPANFLALERAQEKGAQNAAVPEIKAELSRRPDGEVIAAVINDQGVVDAQALQSRVTAKLLDEQHQGSGVNISAAASAIGTISTASLEGAQADIAASRQKLSNEIETVRAEAMVKVREEIQRMREQSVGQEQERGLWRDRDRD